MDGTEVIYGSTDRYDFDKIIEDSIRGQIEVIRALSILAEARIDRHTDFIAARG